MVDQIQAEGGDQLLWPANHLNPSCIGCDEVGEEEMGGIVLPHRACSWSG